MFFLRFPFRGIHPAETGGSQTKVLPSGLPSKAAANGLGGPSAPDVAEDISVSTLAQPQRTAWKGPAGG